MAEGERTIWEMMGQEPPKAYREARLPSSLALRWVRFAVREAVSGAADSIDPADLKKVGGPVKGDFDEPVEVSADVAATVPPLWRASIQPVNVPDARPTDPLRIGDGDDSLVRRLGDFFLNLVGQREAGESPEA